MRSVAIAWSGRGASFPTSRYALQHLPSATNNISNGEPCVRSRLRAHVDWFVQLLCLAKMRGSLIGGSYLHLMHSVWCGDSAGTSLLCQLPPVSCADPCMWSPSAHPPPSDRWLKLLVTMMLILDALSTAFAMAWSVLIYRSSSVLTSSQATRHSRYSLGERHISENTGYLTDSI
jgi:hypothetical protein